jgi:hypothetical protein
MVKREEADSKDKNKNYLSNPILFNVEDLAEINGVINPLWLNVLFGFLLANALPIGNHVGN